MQIIVDYVRLTYERLALRMMRVMTLAHERRIGSQEIKVSVSANGTAISGNTLRPIMGKIAHVRAQGNDVFVLTGGGKLSALDGTSGDLVSASAVYPTPHFEAFGDRVKDWNAVSPDGDATLVITYSDADGQGLDDPGLPSTGVSGGRGGVGCP